MQLDLNLLQSLDALLEEGSVGGAAARMHVTPPAMSRTLDRIRHMTGDPILVRTGRHMTPTPYAVAIREEVHTIVVRAQSVLSQRSTFDLSQLERSFTIQCHDALASALGPELLSHLREGVPLASLRLLPEGPSDTHELLRQGQIDLHIGATLPAYNDMLYTIAGEDRLIVAMRARNPLIERKLTAQKFAEAEHITVSRRGKLQDVVDDILLAQGLRRRVVASAPTVAAALCMVSASDLLVAVPRNICLPIIKTMKIKTAPMPVTLPSSPVVLSWHRRYDVDQAHIWLRKSVGNIINSLLTEEFE